MILVSGYASLDHAMLLDREPRRDVTALVTSRVSRPWPGWGGCGPNVARTVAQRGGRAAALTWLADDAGGEAYHDLLVGEGIDTRPVEIAPGGRTAASWLFYDPDGGPACVYDPGTHVYRGLTDAQQTAVAACDWLVVTVGYAAAAADLLDRLPGTTRLAVGIKADRASYPRDVLSSLLRRADLVSLNRAETRFVEDSLKGSYKELANSAMVIRTAGRDGVEVSWPGGSRSLPVAPIDVADTTGAGDATLGGAVAALGGDSRSLEGDAAVAATQAGIEAAWQMLKQRQTDRWQTDTDEDRS